VRHQGRGGTSDTDTSYDYAIHSDYLVHWTGKDINDPAWARSDKSKTDDETEGRYLERLRNILMFGLWMTAEKEERISNSIVVPPTPKCCFTELKISESRKHAKRYGRLGIGVKRPFVVEHHGRPMVYYGFRDTSKDKFLQACARDLQDKDLLNFFKPMNSSKTLNYDLYSESEWRIIFLSDMLANRQIIDPRDESNEREHRYYKSLHADQQEKLR
jgi:Putative abortive phage resistance protein AbiGi, antitoxin